jgi:hypothetical protein
MLKTPLSDLRLQRCGYPGRQHQMIGVIDGEMVFILAFILLLGFSLCAASLREACK